MYNKQNKYNVNEYLCVKKKGQKMYSDDISINIGQQLDPDILLTVACR